MQWTLIRCVLLLQTAEVDASIQAIGQARNGLRVSREALEGDVQVIYVWVMHLASFALAQSC